jgi:hypothetical protein
VRIESEVYRFTWRSSFDGDAVVCIGQSGDKIMLHWVYRSSIFGDADRRQMPRSRADWLGCRMCWSQPPIGRSIPRGWTGPSSLISSERSQPYWHLAGSDGSDRLIRGRRRDTSTGPSASGAHAALSRETISRQSTESRGVACKGLATGVQFLAARFPFASPQSERA